MVAPLSSLVNMETALYGGFGANAAAPSYLNGYCASPYGAAQGYPSFYGYGSYPVYNNNSTFKQTIPQGYTNNTQQQNSVFQGLTEAETQAIVDDYAISLTPSESLLGCAVTNGLFAFVMNPRLLAHPINSIKTLGTVNKAFADVKVRGSELNKAWVKPENSNILREAYMQMHKAEARKMGKLGAFRRSFEKTGRDAAGRVVSESHLIDKEIKVLKDALKAGDMEAIKKQTARLQHAYSVNQGFIPRAWNKFKGLLGFSTPVTTVSDKLKDTKINNDAIAKRVETLGNSTKTGFKNILKRGGGVKGGLFFAAIEFIMNAGKITKAFDKDKENAKKGIETNNGWKQVGQTSVKAAGSAAGWALGEAAGIWTFTKLGASIGTAFGPGIGTLIGGAVGLIGGGLGLLLAGRVTNKLVGRDVADDIEAENLAQSTEGQVQLLQNTMQRIKDGEKVSPQAQQATQKILSLYA